MTSDQQEFEAWRRARWEEIFGPFGKARVVANGVISGIAPQTIAGVPGQWSTTADGALQIAATTSDGVMVNGNLVEGTVEVPAGTQVALPAELSAMTMGGNGTYGVVVIAAAAMARSGLSGIETYPYDPAWVLQGTYRAAPPGRTIKVDRLTVPRSQDVLPAPVDVVISLAGEERVLTVMEDLPGRRLLIFTDETNGSGTSEIGRWLLLPLLEAGSAVSVDFNRVTLSQHLFSPAVFTCPTEPAGNHLPVRVEAGERNLIFDHLRPVTHQEGKA